MIPGRIEPPTSTWTAGAPFIAVAVTPNMAPPSATAIVDFLIDTGAAYTVLHPRDALQIGFPLFTHDFAHDPSREELGGVGTGHVTLIRLDVDLGFVKEDGMLHVLSGTVWVAEPQPSTPVADADLGNWALPSLLGRDVLQSFDFQLNYSQSPSVRLDPLG